MSKIEQKMQVLNSCIAELRHVARHNGAAIGSDADIAEIAEYTGDIDPERVKAMWLDIATIDQVKNCIRPLAELTREAVGLTPTEAPLSLTAQELLSYEVNDPRLTAGHHSWVVVRITREGTQVLTCGGNFYQLYVREFAEDGGYTMMQKGGTDVLATALSREEVPWLAESLTVDISQGSLYTAEDGTEFIHIPCDLPGNLDQLMTLTFFRRGKENGMTYAPLYYSLTAKSCDTSNEGMIGLPHGLWLIYDNSKLVSAPKGLLIPKDLADGRRYNSGHQWYTDLGCTLDSIYLTYNPLASGMERLRLVGDSFGEEYLIRVIDRDYNLEGTWKE